LLSGLSGLIPHLKGGSEKIIRQTDAAFYETDLQWTEGDPPFDTASHSAAPLLHHP
jgi:hypothetical protein